MERCKYFYVIPPIDWFHGFLTIGDCINQLEKENHLDNINDHINEIGKWLVESVYGLAVHCREWDGDSRGDVYVFGLPNGQSGDYNSLALVVKQDDDGTTFIASPYPLPWLEGS